MKKRTGDPWMKADEYGRSLRGFGVNLLVADIEPCVSFAKSVLGATEIYSDPDFAVLEANGVQWMLHADHTYQDHPMRSVIGELDERRVTRGAGVELRLHQMDPDAAEKLARENNYIVLDGSTDKPHGLREVFIVDPAGYVWVLDKAI